MATGPAKPTAGEQMNGTIQARRTRLASRSVRLRTSFRSSHPRWPVRKLAAQPSDVSDRRRRNHLWLFLLVGSVLILTGLVGLVAAVIGGGAIVARLRTTRQDSLLWVMAIAAEQGMPLAPAVVAFADQYRGKSLPEDLRPVRPVERGSHGARGLGRGPQARIAYAVLLSWIGQATGKLPRALRMAATSRATHLPVWTNIATRLTYILILLLTMQTITFFMMYFIVPKFEAIFRDFNTSLPQVTIMAIEASHFIIKYFYLFVRSFCSSSFSFSLFLFPCSAGEISTFPSSIGSWAAVTRRSFFAHSRWSSSRVNRSRWDFRRWLTTIPPSGSIAS